MSVNGISREALTVVKVDPSDTAAIDKATDLLAAAFAQTPICIALISDVDQLPPSTSHDVIDHDRMIRHFADKIHKITKAGAILSHAGDWSAISVWDPPDFVATLEPGVRHCALLDEWKTKITKVEAKYLGMKTPAEQTDNKTSANEPAFLTVQNGLKPHWHLNYLIRNPTIPAVPGAVSAVVRPFLKRADEDGLPAWLEATTPYAVSIYEHLGFRVVEKVTIGIGRYNEHGWPQTGGAGTSCWAMIYDSHLKN